MPLLLQARNLSHHAGTKSLFHKINFVVNEGERVGLIGHNGSGKSSLLALLRGSVSADDGEIVRRRGLRVGAVEQFAEPALLASGVDQAIAQALRSARQPDDDAARVAANAASTRGEETGDVEPGGVPAYQVDLLRERVGLGAHLADVAVGDLSGGQQNRLLLARALADDPDLLLLDEPGNHLDVATMRWLEAFIVQLQCAVLLVSHDRALLDMVTTRSLILRDERIYSFDLSCSAARSALAEHDLAAAAAREGEEQRIEKLRASAKRLALWGKAYDNEKFARRAQSMEKRVTRLEEEKTFVSRGSGLTLQLDSASTRANRALRVSDLAVHPGEDGGGPLLFNVEELIVAPGERIALLGRNGAGKSSFIRRLVQHYREQRSDTARIAFSPQAVLGYYDQELSELTGARSMLDLLCIETDLPEQTVRQALIHAGFAYRDHDRAVNVLSGGERARVMLIKLSLLKANFLILDEPTNHIDMEGREELEEQLLASGATLLITAHDRRFVDRLATRFWHIAHGRIREELDAERYYEDLLDGNDAAAVPTAMASASDRSSAGEGRDVHGAAQANVAGIEHDEELLLAQLLELEEKLAADLARKPKFQKPQLQADWNTQIAALRKQLRL